MKFVFMLLIFFVLTDPVMAKPTSNTFECLSMYQNYINKYGTSNLIPDNQMRNFIGHCLPDNTVNDSSNNATNSKQFQTKPLSQRISAAKNQPIKT